MRTSGTFRQAMPGGVTTAQKRRDAARKAGKASGVARRQRSTCRRPPRPRTRQEALALAYQQRGITRKDFDAVYELEHPFPDGPDVAGWQWLRGRETAWKIVQALERWWRSQGQHFAFTNAQLLATAGRLGLTLSIRQLQRIRGLLAAFGYGVAAHVRRGGAAAGNRDFLRFERRWTGRRSCVRMYVMPPSGAGASISLPEKCSARSCSHGKQQQQQRPLIAPPSAADDVGRRYAAQGSQEGQQRAIGEDLPEQGGRYATEAERRLAYLELCEAHAPAFIGARQRAELARLRSALGSGQDTARTDSMAAEGDR